MSTHPPLSLSAQDEKFLELAIDEARTGRATGGIPIGSVLALNGEAVGAGHNQRIQQSSPILHGEMAALADAGRLTAAQYQASTMYTTLSPCHMCTGAILLYGIPRVVVGEHRTFMGAEDLLRSHGVEVVVVDSAECIGLMESFIADEPALWFEDIGELDD
ncbi:MAG: nucleoside deaminase [Actinomycetota bacterium]